MTEVFWKGQKPCASKKKISQIFLQELEVFVGFIWFFSSFTRNCWYLCQIYLVFIFLRLNLGTVRLLGILKKIINFTSSKHLLELVYVSLNSPAREIRLLRTHSVSDNSSFCQPQAWKYSLSPHVTPLPQSLSSKDAAHCMATSLAFLSYHLELSCFQ